MIQIIYGVPGSGKSYYAVYHIKKLIEKEKNINLISNIENLKLPHTNLDQLIQEYGGIDKFFNVDCDFWKKDIEIKKILFIDEAQRYFNKRFFSSSVFFFFQYHRHLNCDIYLITQSYKTLPTELVVLSEIVIQAVPSSFRWFKNSFKYLVKDLETFETVEKIDIPFKKDVAELYTSALVISNNKKMTYTQKYLFGSVLLFAVALFILLFVFPHLFLNVVHNHSQNNKKSVVSSQSVSNKQSSASSNSSLPTLPAFKSDGFEYPGGISSKGYKQKEISYGEFLNRYRNGVVYDLSVNYIIIYDKHNRPKKTIIYKEEDTPKDTPISDNNNDNNNVSSVSSNLAENSLTSNLAN